MGNVLVACEFSGIVRDAFTRHGHNAVSCDLLPSDTDGPHFQGDITKLLDLDIKWDLVIAHPFYEGIAEAMATQWGQLL